MSILNLPSYILGKTDPIEKIKYLRDYGIDAKWFPGISTDNDTPEIRKNYVSSLYNKVAVDSIIRISVTHMKIWELAVEKNHPYTMIFEDDIIMNKDFKQLVEKTNYLKMVPDDVDILYLGAIGAYIPNSPHSYLFSMLHGQLPKKYIDINDSIKIPYNAVGLHAYIISLKGAKRLLNLMRGKLNTIIDIMINDLRYKQKINAYIVYPELIYQTSTNGKTKSSNISSQFPIVLTKFSSKITIDRYVTLDYALNINFFKIGPFIISPSLIFFLLIGIIFARNRIKLETLNLIFLIIAIPDFMFTKISKQKFIQMILVYILVIGPTLIRN